MLVKQIDTEEALRLAAKGKEVKVLVPNGQEGAWEEVYPTTVRKMLEGCLFFRDEAVENQEANNEVEPEKEKPVITKKPKKVVDRGKVAALHQAGRSNKWIADDMKLHISTVNRVIRELKEEGKLDETTDAEG